KATASAGVPALALEPSSCAKCSSLARSRLKESLSSCPADASCRASPPPIRPAPMIPILTSPPPFVKERTLQGTGTTQVVGRGRDAGVRRRRAGVSSHRMSEDDTATRGRTRTWRFRPFVKRYVNPVTRPMAKRLPSFAILTHRGRKSGRTFRTPMNVFQQGDDYYFFLTYGSDVQWVKNVLAAGSCSIETRGRVIELVEP